MTAKSKHVSLDEMEAALKILESYGPWVHKGKDVDLDRISFQYEYWKGRKIISMKGSSGALRVYARVNLSNKTCSAYAREMNENSSLRPSLEAFPDVLGEIQGL